MVYSDLLASLAKIEGFPYSFDLAGPAERCTVGVRWRAGLSLAGHLDCSVGSCPLPDPDLLTTSFAGSPRLSAWLEGLAESAAVPLSPAYTALERSDSALVCCDRNLRLANAGQQGEAPATVPMMVCYYRLGKSGEAPRVPLYGQRDD